MQFFSLARRAILAVLLAILAPAAANAADMVKIATFNIQILGTTKINKPAIRKYLLGGFSMLFGDAGAFGAIDV